MPPVLLGYEVVDKVTGFTGVASVEGEFLYGCRQYGVAPKVGEDGERKDIQWFDEGRLTQGALVVKDVATGITPWPEHIQLGTEAEDVITGFKGIITARARYLFGNVEYALTPKSDKDKMKDSMWIDHGRIVFKGHGLKPKDVQGEKKGGPQRDLPPTRRI